MNGNRLCVTVNGGDVHRTWLRIPEWSEIEQEYVIWWDVAQRGMESLGHPQAVKVFTEKILEFPKQI